LNRPYAVGTFKPRHAKKVLSTGWSIQLLYVMTSIGNNRQQRLQQSKLQELDNFFLKLRDALPQKVSPKALPLYPYLSNCLALERWFSELAEPIIEARRSGFLCDPWDVAGLKRDEVRNSKVLAWLLDPKGSHGLESKLMCSLLTALRISSQALNFPESPHNTCRVRVESSPDGDRSNRLDIEIDDPNFYLIIEVKIDAVESNDQLLKYGKLGQTRSMSRPWAIVFLTPHGFFPVTAGNYEDKVIPLSWKRLSVILSQPLRAKNTIKSPFGTYEIVPQLLAKRFLQHIRKF